MHYSKKCEVDTEILANYLSLKSNVNENQIEYNSGYYDISNYILSFFGLNGYFYSTDDPMVQEANKKKKYSAGEFDDALRRLFFFYQDIRIFCSSNHPEIKRVNKIMDSALEDDRFLKHFKDYFGSIGTEEAFEGFFNNYLLEGGKRNKERADKVLPAAEPDQKDIIELFFLNGSEKEEKFAEIVRKNKKKEEKLELAKKQIEKRDLDKQKNTETCPIPKKELDFAELEANVKLNVLNDPDNHKIFINSVQVIFDFYTCVNDYDSKTLEKIDNFFDMALHSKHGNIVTFQVEKLLKKQSDKQFIYMLKYSSHKKLLLDGYRKLFTDKQLSLFDAEYNLHPLLEALLVERESKRKILREEAEQGKENVESENNKLELEYNQKLLKLEDEISKSGNNEVFQAAVTTSEEIGGGKTTAETEAANNMETIEVNPTMETTEAITSSPTSCTIYEIARTKWQIAHAHWVIERAIKDGVLKTLLYDVKDHCDEFAMEVKNSIPRLWENPENQKDILSFCNYIFGDITPEDCITDLPIYFSNC